MPERRAVARSPWSTLCISARTQEEIGAAVVGNEKAESVGMSLHGSGDEIELGDDAELALAVHQQLAVALHRLDAAEERDASALVDVHLPREIRTRAGAHPPPSAHPVSPRAKAATRDRCRRGGGLLAIAVLRIVAAIARTRDGGSTTWANPPAPDSCASRELFAARDFAVR